MVAPGAPKRFEPGATHQVAKRFERQVRSVWGEHRRRPVENQTGDALRRLQRESQRDARALRHAENGGPLDVQAIHHQCEILDVPLDRGRARREPEAAAIVCDDAPGAAQRVELRRPHVKVERPAVDQEERRPLPCDAHAQTCVRRIDGAFDVLRAGHFEVLRTGWSAWDGSARRVDQCLPHRRSLAICAPSTSERNLSQATSGSTGPKPAKVPKPQSVPAMTRSRPT